MFKASCISQPLPIILASLLTRTSTALPTSITLLTRSSAEAVQGPGARLSAPPYLTFPNLTLSTPLGLHVHRPLVGQPRDDRNLPIHHPRGRRVHRCPARMVRVPARLSLLLPRARLTLLQGPLRVVLRARSRVEVYCLRVSTPYGLGRCVSFPVCRCAAVELTLSAGWDNRVRSYVCEPA